MAKAVKPKRFRLTKANYYSTEACQAYCSASFVKSFMNCQESAMAEMNGEYKREETVALLVGGYVDAFFEGRQSFERFRTEHPQIFNSRTGELKSDFKLANLMIERAINDKLFMSFMKGQKQKIVTGNIGGVPFKCKLDVFNGERIVDLKTVKDLEGSYLPEQGKVNFAARWLWTLQMAIYQEIVRQKTGKLLPCYLCVITKQEVPDIAVVEIPQHTLDAEMKVLLSIIYDIDAVRSGIIAPERCEKCMYCRTTKVLNGVMSLDEFDDI